MRYYALAGFLLAVGSSHAFVLVPSPHSLLSSRPASYYLSRSTQQSLIKNNGQNQRQSSLPLLLMSSSQNSEDNNNNHGEDTPAEVKNDDDSLNSMNTMVDDDEEMSRRAKLRKQVKLLAKRMASPVEAIMPNAIASVLRDATLGAVDMAVEEVMTRSPKQQSTTAPTTTTTTTTGASSLPSTSSSSSSSNKDKDSEDSTMDLTLDYFLVNDAFEPMERSLEEMEASLVRARVALTVAKSQASLAMEAIQAAAMASAEGAASVVRTAEEAAERKVINDIYDSADLAADTNSNVEDGRPTLEGSLLTAIDFNDSEMAPPFLDEASCLVPGEPIVRVERAPENSRRIFAGIDISASVDDVWNILTSYSTLQNVIPNLVVNEVLDMYDGITDYDKVKIDDNGSGQEQCQEMADQMKGSLLKQVGGAKVAGINFSARTTLEVREWPAGLPDFAHYQDAFWDGKSRDARAKEYTKTKLERYIFPRPFAISSLPTKDISMQSIGDDDGEFRLYQGVWRMQPLPGCAAPGRSAMRLTYAVEISPRAYLPVQLVEGRIVKDLCSNLLAIRDSVASNDEDDDGA